MKVILKQSGREWIDLCIEFSDVCITIETSSSFDPYERLYIWLGKIRDSQLPEKMVIDEEGYGVELIVEEDPLTTDQESILLLRGVLERIAIANRDFSVEIQDLANLYKTLPEDIILNEIDFDWYQEHRLKLDIKHDRSWGAIRKKSKHYLNLCKFRIESLKLGQIIDGTIVGIRHYGVFVDIGGCNGLLHNSEISQLEIDHPNQIFTEKDWVRAIIIDLDVERGRVTLSTSVLEPEAGDMLKEPWKVYARSEEMAARYHQNVLAKIVEVD